MRPFRFRTRTHKKTSSPPNKTFVVVPTLTSRRCLYESPSQWPRVRAALVSSSRFRDKRELLLPSKR
ncbi:hypothetical protein ACA910_017765 [Epithemia clementina (nom. ined.)]